RLDAGEDAVELGMRVELLVLFGRAGPADVHGEKIEPAREHFRPRLLPFRNDYDRRFAYSQAWVLIGRALDATRRHQPDVYPVGHPVGLDDVEEPRLQGLARQADVDAEHFRAVPQPVEMALKEGDAAVDQAQALPDAIAEHEARVEHGDSGFRARRQRPVDADQHQIVARI